MNTCLFCSKLFDPHELAGGSLLSCKICKLQATSLYKIHRKKKLDTSDVCWGCDEEILKEHNEQHTSVDII